MYLLYALVFPGLLFSSVFGLWLAGVDRKVVARMQKRIGPPIMQPTYDFFKLLGKETIIPANAATTTFMLAPYVGLVSLVVLALFIPVGGFQAFGGMADIVVVLYLLTIPSLSIIFGGSASGNPFAGVGVSRSMVAIMAYELPLILVLLAVSKAVSGNGMLTFSLEGITTYQKLNGSLLFDWRLLPAAVAMLLVIPCEVGSHPFDVGEAETEICEGPLVEYSGAPLAVFKLSHAIKMFVMTALFAALFLGGIATGMLWLDIVIALLICTVVTIICMSFLHAITARLKVEQVFKFFWTVVSGLALVSLILVWIGI
ncbi:MAG: NADH-quinone oxidoreductase subunit H [Ruminococcaceae bacterium]|nr:NADH-quinone oxidoreductase subunit H [Oscillospiraceae bacterium]